MTPREYNSAKCYTAILLKIYKKELKASPEKKTELLENLLVGLKVTTKTLKVKKNFYFFSSLTRAPRPKRELYLNKACEVLNLPGPLTLFVKLVVQNQRIGIFHRIAQVAEVAVLDLLGREKCTVFSSHALSKTKQDEIKTLFEQKIGKELDVLFKVKEGLLLGLQVIAKDYIWESSFAQQLQRMTLAINLGVDHE